MKKNEKKNINIKPGDRDRNGNVVVEVSPEGWYRDDRGAIRDPNGYEWYADHAQMELPETRVEKDAQTGPAVVVRDFKVAMKSMQLANPQEFIKHWMPTIKQTMVETGWDFADVKEPIKFGEAKDGYVHIYVEMKKKAWKNRENAWSGMKSGEGGIFKSPALVKAGAFNPHILGVSQLEKEAEDILANREKRK